MPPMQQPLECDGGKGPQLILSATASTYNLLLLFYRFIIYIPVGKIHNRHEKHFCLYCEFFIIFCYNQIIEKSYRLFRI